MALVAVSTSSLPSAPRQPGHHGRERRPVGHRHANDAGRAEQLQDAAVGAVSAALCASNTWRAITSFWISVVPS